MVAGRAHFNDKDCALEYVRGEWRLRSLNESGGLKVYVRADSLDEMEALFERLQNDTHCESIETA